MRQLSITKTSNLPVDRADWTLVGNYGMAAGGNTTLPSINRRVTFTIMVEVAAQAWNLRSPAGEVFVLNGTALHADDVITLGQTVGDSAILTRFRTGANTYRWHFKSMIGTHTDGGQI